MANIRKLDGAANVVWGTENVVSGFGYVVSARKTNSSERIPVLDNNGVPAGTVYVPQYDEIECEILCESTTNIPAIGDNLTIDGSVGGVENVEQAWEQKGIKKLRVRAAALPA